MDLKRKSDANLQNLVADVERFKVSFEEKRALDKSE